MKTGLKILHVLDHSLPLHSGYTFRSQEILRAQRKRGWDPFVVTSPKHEESWKKPTEPMEAVNGFRYFRSGAVAPGRFPAQSELKLMSALRSRILEVAAAEKPDLLHAHSPVLNALPALKAGKSLGVPVVYEIRAFWEDAAVDNGHYAQTSWKYKVTRWLETSVCRRASQVAVLCNGLRHDLVARGIPDGKLSVVFNGINLDDFAPCPPDAEFLAKYKRDGAKVVGFIGSFYRYEGLDLLIDAMARLRQKRSDVVCLLIGGGEMEAELKAQVARLGLESAVVMPGRIPHERVPGLYGIVDVLAYPRLESRLTDLVTPLKPMEAMAMHKAVVASDVGGHRELIQHDRTGVLFKAGDAGALAAALERLIDRADERERLQRQGYDWVRQVQTWDRTLSVYGEIYERALTRASRA